MVTATRPWDTAPVRAIRRRVRLRTRLARAAEAWRNALPGRLSPWSGRLGPLPGLVSHTVTLPGSGRGTATVTLAVTAPVPVARLVAAARRVLEPAHPTPTPGAGLSPGAGPLPGAGLPPGGDPLARGDPPAGGAAAGHGALVFDATSANPRGRGRHRPGLPACELSLVPGPDADPLEWEIRGVAQRRAAIRNHGTGVAHPAGAPGPRRLPVVSALLVTRRPELVARAVGGLAAQTYPELELVLGMHGVEPPSGLELPGRLPTRLVTIPAGRSLGEALDAATRAACGSLLTKVDDDDLYGPEHVWDLVLARHYSGATVSGKGAEFVHAVPRGVTVRRRMASEEFTDTVAGGTILISRGDLEAAGGWPPVPRSVDRGLLDRVLSGGGLVYRTHPFGFIYSRHDYGHTWDPGIDYFLVDPVRTWRGLPRHREFGT